MKHGTMTILRVLLLGLATVTTVIAAVQAVAR